MYFSMHEERHVCSLELRLDPGTGMQCSKQFSFTFWMRNLAFSTEDWSAMAFWIFWRISEGGEAAEAALENGDDIVVVDDDVSVEEDEDESFEPPKKPPNAIVLDRGEVLGGFLIS